MQTKNGLIDLTPAASFRYAAAEPAPGKAPSAAGSVGEGTGSAAPVSGSEGKAQAGQGAGNGSIDPERLARENRELAAQVEALSKQTKELLTENVGRKKLVQRIAQATGEMSPEELQSKLERLHALEEDERIRKGAFDEEREAWRNERSKLKDEVVQTKQREATRVLHNRILSAAGAQRALDSAMGTPEGGGRPIIVKITEDLFEYDVDSGEVYHKTARDPETGKRHTPESFFARERTKSLASFFQSGVMSGSGATPKSGDGDGSEVVKIDYDDRDKVRKAEAAKKAGKRYEIVRGA